VLKPCSTAALKPCSTAALKPCSTAALKPCSTVARGACARAAGAVAAGAGGSPAMPIEMTINDGSDHGSPAAAGRTGRINSASTIDAIENPRDAHTTSFGSERGRMGIPLPARCQRSSPRAPRKAGAILLFLPPSRRRVMETVEEK
jgi:hypothetical protein